MLLVPYIRENKDAVIAGLKVKNFKQIDILDQIIAIDDSRRDIQKKLDDTLSESNSIAK